MTKNDVILLILIVLSKSVEFKKKFLFNETNVLFVNGITNCNTFSVVTSIIIENAKMGCSIGHRILVGSGLTNKY
jgi:hypothetical protein